MNIYIRIESNDDGYCGWWTFDINGESHLVDGRTLRTISEIIGEEYARGTACTSIKQAKREAKIARATAISDGIVNPKVSFWRQIGNKLIQTKFTPDNKIKAISNSVVLKGKDMFELFEASN